MERQDKELLIRYLCEGLPHGLKCDVHGHVRDLRYVDVKKEVAGFESELGDGYVPQEYPIEEVKPYVRPMSDMSDEEKEELRDTYDFLYSDYPFENEYEDEDEDVVEGHYEPSAETYDWYKRKKFDYRGLIAKGLVLSTEEFNPYKK